MMGRQDMDSCLFTNWSFYRELRVAHQPPPIQTDERGSLSWRQARSYRAHGKPLGRFSFL